MSSMPQPDETQKRLKAIIDGAVFAIITIDAEGIIQDFNASAERMFGYEQGEVIGRNVSLLMPEPFRSAHDDFIRQYLTTGQRKIIGHGREVTGERRDGSKFAVHLTVSEVQLADRTLFTGMIEDISARVDAEQRVQQLQNELIHVARLSAMGELASALAHELNQPLTAITNYSNAAKRLLESDKAAAATDLVLKASEQALRAGEIIRRLRQFIEWGETDRTWNDLEPIVNEAAQLGLIGTRSWDLDFSMTIEPDLPRVMIDRVQIQQVVQNIVRNAVDALEAWPGDRRIFVALMRRDDDMVDILIEDTGPGLEPTIKEKLFQPFVTTKPTGMGVGLSVCRNIIEAHGGRIAGEDREGGGTRFRVTLPSEQA
jgi:two-component system sensor kinase FixL